jgi:hypothetical protein
MAIIPKASKTPQHDALLSLFTQLTGVSMFALIAGISDEVGSMMVVVMVGIAIYWAISHVGTLSTIAGKA